MSTAGEDSELVVNVAEIDPRIRHTIIFQLFAHLAPDKSLQLVVDHNPRRLHLQLQAQFGARCAWAYLEEGPDLWRVRLRRLAVGAISA